MVTPALFPRAFLLAAALGAAPSISAATVEFDGGTSNAGSAWHTLANWTGDGRIAGDSALTTGDGLSDDVVTYKSSFTGTAMGINATNIGATLSLGAFDVNRTASTTLGQSSGTINAATTLRLNGATVNSVANTLFRLQGANFTIQNAAPSNATSGVTLNLQLGITNGIFDIAASRTLTISSVISGLNASTGFTKTGAGTLLLTGANATANMTGTMTLSDGVIQLGGDGALGAAGASLALNGGTLSSNGVTARTLTAAGASTIGGNITLGNATNTGALTFANNFDLGGATRTLTTASGVTLSGIVSNGGLSKAGSSTLVLSGANTYSGGTSISAGTLYIDGASSLGGGAVTLSGGTLEFRNSARTLTNAFNVTGSATVYSRVIRTTLNTGAITLSNGVTLTFNSGGDGTNSFSVSNAIGLAVGATGANLTVSHDATNTSNYNGVINLGTGTLTKGSTANATFGSAGSVTAAEIRNNGSGNLTFSGQVTTNSITHLSAVSTTSASALTLSSALNSIGTITVNGGDLRLDSDAASNAAITLSASSNAQLQVTSGTFSVNSDLTISGGTGSGVAGQGALWYAASSGTLTWAGDISILAAMTNGGHLATNGAMLEVSGDVLYSGGTVVVRTGNVTFSGTGNSFNQLNLSQGLVRVGFEHSLAAASVVRVGDNASAATLDLNGFNQSVGALTTTSTGTRTVKNDALAISSVLTLTGRTVNSVAHTVIDASTNSNFTIGGGISALNLTLDAGANVPVVNVDGALTLSAGLTSAQGFSKTGAGTLTISSSQPASLSGAVTVANGIIQLVGGGDGRLGSSASVVLGSAAATGKLVLGSAAGASHQTLSGLSQSGLGGTVTGGNSTHFSILTLDLSSGLALGTFLGGSTDAERRVSLTKAGVGTLTLNGANDYAGVTTVSAGTLVLAHASALGSGQVVVSTGGTLDLGGLDISNVVRAEGGSITGGSGWTGSVRLSGAVDNAYLAALPGNTLAVVAGSSLNLAGVTSLGGKSIVYTGGTLLGDNDALLIEVGDGATLGSAFGTGTAVIKSGRTVTFDNFFNQAVRYEGGTLVNLINYEGTLTVAANSTLDLDGADNTPVETAVTINVDAGSTLKGTGSFAGGTISGTHAPGNSPGVQTSQGNLAYTNGASVQWELIDNTTLNLPVAHDQIVVNGNLSFSGAVSLNLVFDGAGSTVDWENSFWDNPQSWVVYDVSGSLSGVNNLILSAVDWEDSNNVALSAARPGFTFAIGQSGSDVVLNYQPIPEPSTYGLAFGMLALASVAVRRRRRRVAR